VLSYLKNFQDLKMAVQHGRNMLSLHDTYTYVVIRSCVLLVDSSSVLCKHGLRVVFCELGSYMLKIN